MNAKKGIEFYIKLSLIITLFATIAVYGAYQSRRILSSPSIAVSSPSDGATVSDSVIIITGTVLNASNISLDDNPIIVDESGNFKEKRALLPGFNAIKIRAVDQFNKSAEKILQVVYKPALNL